MTNCTFRGKKVEEHDRTKISGALRQIGAPQLLRQTGASHFRIRSGATGYFYLQCLVQIGVLTVKY